MKKLCMDENASLDQNCIKNGCSVPHSMRVLVFTLFILIPAKHRLHSTPLAIHIAIIIPAKAKRNLPSYNSVIIIILITTRPQMQSCLSPG